MPKRLAQNVVHSEILASRGQHGAQGTSDVGAIEDVDGLRTAQRVDDLRCRDEQVVGAQQTTEREDVALEV